MIADSSLLIQFQLALIGIVLVTGLFYLYRCICRTEDKVNRLSNKLEQQLAMCQMSGGGKSCGGGGMNDFRMSPLNLSDADASADELMKQVFGELDNDNDDIVMFSVPLNMGKTDKPVSNLKLEEVSEEVQDVTEQDEVAPSEAETDAANPLSKSKLHKMNTDELKQLCAQRGLATEGAKKILIDRLLGLSRE